MSEDRTIRIKRLQYQSWYRGCKETDRVLGWFAKQHLHELDEAELDVFEAILDESDNDIFAWKGGEPLPERYQGNTVMQRILAFDVASMYE